MDRDALSAAGLAVVGIAAVALSAATVSSTTEPTGGGGGGTGSGGGGVPLLEAPAGGLLDVPFLGEVFVLIAVVGLALWLLKAARNPRKAAAVLAALAVMAVVGWLVLQALGAAEFSGTAPSVEPAQLPEGSGPSGDGGGSGGGDGGPAPPTELLLALVGAGLLVAALAAARRRVGPASAPDADPGDDGGPTTGPSAAAVGRAAGRAADRLEAGADPDNEVYRAWREMTDLLEVSRPETKAPGEFAAAAVDAGMDPDDVGELTGLFEQVRYGGRDPTEGDERRALAVLRRIEEAYADGEEPADAHDADGSVGGDRP